MSETNSKVIIDEDVIKKIADGDIEAAEELYRISYRPVFAFLLSLTQNYQDAEDLLQETYIKVCRGAYLYRPGGNPMAWIMKIARNLFLSKCRKESGMENVCIDELQEDIPFENLTETEDRMLLETVLLSLNIDERTVIVLHLADGFRFREIADVLDKPLGTILSLYNRGIKKLKRLYGEKSEKQ